MFAISEQLGKLVPITISHLAHTMLLDERIVREDKAKIIVTNLIKAKKYKQRGENQDHFQ